MCAFKLFDLDKNGYVDVTEFSRVLIGFGYPGGQTKAGRPEGQKTQKTRAGPFKD